MRPRRQPKRSNLFPVGLGFLAACATFFLYCLHRQQQLGLGLQKNDGSDARILEPQQHAQEVLTGQASNERLEVPSSQHDAVKALSMQVTREGVKRETEEEHIATTQASPEPVSDAQPGSAASQSGDAAPPRTKPAVKATAKRPPSQYISYGAASPPAGQSCEAWLEEADKIEFTRDFTQRPVVVEGQENKDFPAKECSVGCRWFNGQARGVDYVDGNCNHRGKGRFPIRRNMESAGNYPDLKVDTAHAQGWKILAHTSLDSDVPCLYASWHDYEFLKPLANKTERTPASAFISNCGASSFRLQALTGLISAGVPVDSYGACQRNRNQADYKDAHPWHTSNYQSIKEDIMEHYRFHLAFENTLEDDYVTEKFFGALIAGSVPVVIGAPTIAQDWAPGPNTVLLMKSPKDIQPVGARMTELMTDDAAYKEMLRWKETGPSDQFKSLIDLGVRHSGCRACMVIADTLRREDIQASPRAATRPCRCSGGGAGPGGTVHHVYVRARGDFEYRSVFLRDEDLTMEGLRAAILKAFQAAGHVPDWTLQRDSSGHSLWWLKREKIPHKNPPDFKLKVFKIYPAETYTVRDYMFRGKAFAEDATVQKHIAEHKCAKLEVIFV